MARRRSSPRVVWLPQDPFFSVDAAGLDHCSVMAAFGVLENDIGNIDTIVAPVVRDATPNPLNAATTLADLYGSGYRLRRIVGKLWAAFTIGPTPADATFPDEAVCIAGFIILRTDDAGLALQAATPGAYSPAIIENAEAPWIWRRAWHIHNDEARTAYQRLPGGVEALSSARFNNTSQMGGNADGAHIDQKTARVVGPDERLFLVLSTVNMSGGGQGLIRNIQYTWDVRVLASLRQNVGNRRNASR